MKNIKNWNEFQRVNELRSETYSKVMKRTEGYPWRMTQKDDAGNYITNQKAKQEERVNRLAHERFETEFKNEFPPKMTIINMNGKPFEFVNIRFVNNFGSYYLIFEELGDPGLRSQLRVYRHRDSANNSYFIEYEGKKYYNEDGNTGLDQESENLILDMLKHTMSTTAA